ncbi:hypothetical protein EV702DRAFT_90832 [Suillus placidus]|uniref:Uncharacterized protein n=1 Tax=Suillus placidus TaxID=48579 RepID=A0A9P7CW78_9AGAM|nr:hypothetical protein EV702DRAFT_90832 [Suillus placidus]
MNSTQIRRIRRAVKRVKYKEEHGPPPRDVRSKASMVTKTSKKDKENGMEGNREHEQEFSEEDKQEDNDKGSQTKDDKEDDQKSVKEKYNEGVKENDIEDDDDDEGFVEGLTDDALVYDKEGVEEDFMKEDEEGVKESVAICNNELTKDDNRGVEEQFAGENDDGKENATEDDNVRLEEDFIEDDEGDEEDVTKVDNKGVEDSVAVYDSTIVEEIYAVNNNERVDERVEDVPGEHDEVVINRDDNEGHTKTAAGDACKFTPLTHHRNLRQRNGVIMIPSLIKGWPPVLLSEPVIDRLDPIDFKIMQLEYEYHLSRDELHDDRFV